MKIKKAHTVASLKKIRKVWVAERAQLLVDIQVLDKQIEKLQAAAKKSLR